MLTKTPHRCTVFLVRDGLGATPVKKGIAMPKELIQRPTTSFDNTELTVNWSKADVGGYVQLGLTRHIVRPVEPGALCSPMHADHANCGECEQSIQWLEEHRSSGQPQMMIGHTGADSPPPSAEFDDPATVYTTVLTRSQINDMIRALRRARDQAYGADA